MPETFADSPTKSAEKPVAIRDLWSVTVRFETSEVIDEGIQTQPVETVSVVYTVVRAPHWQRACEKAIADIYAANDQSDVEALTIIMVNAELLPPVLE